MSLHSDTLFWILTNNTLLLLRSIACLEATSNNVIVFDLIQPGLEPTIKTIFGSHQH
jgi:hypothetical protein